VSGEPTCPVCEVPHAPSAPGTVVCAITQLIAALDVMLDELLTSIPVLGARWWRWSVSRQRLLGRLESVRQFMDGCA